MIERKNKVDEAKREEAFYRSGIIASTIANCFRDKKQRKKPFKPKDFMPDQKSKDENKQNWESQLKIIEALNASMGGSDKRKKGGGN